MKKKVINISILVLVSLPLIYLGVSAMIFFFSVKVVEKPNYEDRIFKSNPKLIHFSSEKTNNGNTVSIYNYNKFQRGMLVTRFKINEQNLEEILIISNNKASDITGTSKGSIFRDYLSYTFNNDTIVNKIKIHLENYNQKMIKFKTDSLVYFNFNLNKSISININEDEVLLYAKSKNSNELNEMVLFIDDSYLYVIYSKPISQYELENEFDLLKTLELDPPR